jgi:hypothetical protein
MLDIHGVFLYTDLMKYTVSTELKFVKVLKKIHTLKIKYINNDVMFSSLSDIYNDIDLILEIYKNQKLTDKEQAIIVAVKKEKVADKVRKSYKKKLSKAQRLLDKVMSPDERKKVGYLKHKAKERLTQLDIS